MTICFNMPPEAVLAMPRAFPAALLDAVALTLPVLICMEELPLAQTILYAAPDSVSL
jgi:hypothetical protein